MEIVGIFFFLFWLAMMAAIVTGIVLWIKDIIEFVNIPEEKFTTAGVDRTTAMLILILLGVIGMLIWRFAGWRAKVLTA